MNTKQTFILLVIAVALILAAVWFKKSEEHAVQSAAPPTRDVMKGVTSATVEQIEIRVPGSPEARLAKRDAAWYTDIDKGHRADQNLVGNLFAAVEKDIEGDVVSDIPENYAEYLVDETSATRVKIFGRENKVLADLYVGKAGSSFFTTFVRVAGQKEVVSANASLTYVFNKPEGWRDKGIFSINADDIVEFSGELTSGTVLAKKAGDSWKLEKPVAREAQMTKFQPLLSSVANLRASGFADRGTTQPLSDFGLDPARQKITVVHRDKSTSPAKEVSNVLLLGGKQAEGGMVYVKRADTDDIFTITEYQANMLSPNPMDLVMPEPEPAPTASQTPETTSTLEAAKDSSEAAALPAANTEPESAETRETQANDRATSPAS